MANRTFKDLNSLFNYIEKNVKASLREVGMEVEQIIKDYIMKELYNSYSPTSYTRTYDFVNSLRVGKVIPDGDGYSVKLYFDTDAIYPRDADGSDRWSSHQNITDGTDVSNLIPLFLEEGVSGSLWDRDGIYSMWHTKTELEQSKKHVKKLMDILKSKGFNVTLG